ncbi:hypothetical protein [Streptomyces sp. NPDC056983]|uniref:hypothetical protein n=1 Tax=Streptomyces sp. NPDC056983 TaxID=3345987 RepID=UPI003636A843
MREAVFGVVRQEAVVRLVTGCLPDLLFPLVAVLRELRGARVRVTEHAPVGMGGAGGVGGLDAVVLVRAGTGPQIVVEVGRTPGPSARGPHRRGRSAVTAN